MVELIPETNLKLCSSYAMLAAQTRDIKLTRLIVCLFFEKGRSGVEETHLLKTLKLRFKLLEAKD